LRVYLDTNVVVSAVGTRGLCADVLQAVLAGHELVVGEAMLAELHRVLQQKLGLSPELVNEAEAFLRRQATVIVSGPRVSIEGVDRADAAVVGEAAAGTADLFVTGDHELLTARGLPVKAVSPRDLWDRLRRAT
jgi:putative PIN family toxin of toxin-antitoxin system